MILVAQGSCYGYLTIFLIINSSYYVDFITMYINNYTIIPELSIYNITSISNNISGSISGNYQCYINSSNNINNLSYNISSKCESYVNNTSTLWIIAASGILAVFTMIYCYMFCYAYRLNTWSESSNEERLLNTSNSNIQTISQVTTQQITSIQSSSDIHDIPEMSET